MCQLPLWVAPAHPGTPVATPLAPAHARLDRQECLPTLVRINRIRLSWDVFFFAFATTSIDHLLRHGIRHGICFPCRKYLISPSDSAFTVRGFSVWKHAVEVGKGLNKHAASKEHITSMTLWKDREKRAESGLEIDSCCFSRSVLFYLL